ncbi:restriction endonuclease [Microbacterium sp. No. 7]|uniref:restriction endonuclease n=1 Tax=Microbacterium sp. No. 7 TaxID=1714373 RepID=UPI00300BD919
MPDRHDARALGTAWAERYLAAGGDPSQPYEYVIGFAPSREDALRASRARNIGADRTIMFVAIGAAFGLVGLGIPLLEVAPIVAAFFGAVLIVCGGVTLRIASRRRRHPHPTPEVPGRARGGGSLREVSLDQADFDHHFTDAAMDVLYEANAPARDADRKRRMADSRLRHEEALEQSRLRTTARSKEDASERGASTIASSPVPDAVARLAPRPAPQPYGVSFVGAERLVCEWMRHLGETDAIVTQVSGDGGIDVISSTSVAQVKHQSGAVGRPDIQKLAGAALDGHTGKTKLFFSSGTYSAGAIEYANVVDVVLIRFDPEAAELHAYNEVAKSYLEARQ